MAHATSKRSRPQTAMWADIGGREEQQDRVAVFQDASAQMLVVADGLGGHENGAYAAQAVVDAAQYRLECADCFQDAEAQLAAVVADAHRRINSIEAAGPRKEQPHSTCVLLHIANGAATWAHVGDSRLYHFEDGRFADRTLDHSIVEMMRLRGKITEEEMKAHPDQNRLYGALGGPQVPRPDFGSKIVTAEDAFLLASDGIWENVSNAELEGVFDAQDLTAALRGLVASARDSGGGQCDNLAVAAWRWWPPAAPTPSAVQHIQE